MNRVDGCVNTFAKLDTLVRVGETGQRENGGYGEKPEFRNEATEKTENNGGMERTAFDECVPPLPSLASLLRF